jgi:hypothetical protein
LSTFEDRLQHVEDDADLPFVHENRNGNTDTGGGPSEEHGECHGKERGPDKGVDNLSIPLLFSMHVLFF